MNDQALIEKFNKKCPLAVLTQVAIRATMADELDNVFHAQRSRQYEGEMVFSDLALAVVEINLNLAKNPNQAYQTQQENPRVSRTSFHNKLNAMELPISEGVVRRSAERAAELMDELRRAPVGGRPRLSRVRAGRQPLARDRQVADRPWRAARTAA